MKIKELVVGDVLSHELFKDGEVTPVNFIAPDEYRMCGTYRKLYLCNQIGGAYVTINNLFEIGLAIAKVEIDFLPMPVYFYVKIRKVGRR